MTATLRPARGPAPLPGPRPRRRPGRRLALLATGEAGQATAWVLAVAALLAAFLATAAPREVTATGTVALRRALAGLQSSETGVTGTAQWLAIRGNKAHTLTTAGIDGFSDQVAALMHPPVVSPRASRWSGFVTTLEGVSHPARSARLSLPPSMEVAYRSDLAAHVRLVSGTMPGQAGATGALGQSQAGQGQAGQGSAGHGSAGQRHAAPAPVQIVVTPATAARFSLHPGSALRVGTAIRLVVTGIVVPADPRSPFWTTDPLLATPETEGAMASAHWISGAMVGSAEAGALQAAVSGQFVQGTWFLGLSLGGVTPARLPALLRGVAGITTSDVPTGFSLPGGGRFSFQAPPVLSSDLAAGLSSFRAQQRSASAIGSLIVVGLLAASLILVLICAGLAADAYRPELALLRVRGGSTRQASARVLGRACLVAWPAAAVGGVAAVLAVPASGTALPWLPAVAVAVAVAAAPAALAAWQHRQARLTAGRREELAVLRRSPRRTVAEATVVILAAGALATLHLQGTRGQSNAYTSASPILAALAASLIVARVYPLPLRSLLRLAAGGPGPVGFVGLAGAARSRHGTALPALALVLTMTMAAFAAMVAASVAAGQTAASWQQVGADAAVQAAGDNVVSGPARRALRAVPGVTAVTGVYTAPDTGPFSGELTETGGPARSVGLAVVDPAGYAALAAHTPWPAFPARLLARTATAHPPVPVLASQRLAGMLGAGPGSARGPGGLHSRPVTGVLELDGATIRVIVAAVIGTTPAATSGGSFVVLPQWAAAALPSIPGPDVLLATGRSAGSRQFRRIVAARVPGGQLTVRQSVLSAMRGAPAQSAAERVNTLGIWAAGALAALAVLLGLAVSARGRARLASRMSALGMAAGQARALALTETIPLLAVGVLGMAVAAWGLALLIGPALNLAVFAAGVGVVPVQPHLAALLLPAAGAIVVAAAIVGIHSALTLRASTGAALRQEEAA